MKTVLTWFLTLLRRWFGSTTSDGLRAGDKVNLLPPPGGELPPGIEAGGHTVLRVEPTVFEAMPEPDPEPVSPASSPIKFRRGETNDQVRELQAMMVTLGYVLPRWGTDGNLGTETLDALDRLLHDHDHGAITDDDDRFSVSEAELALVRKLYAAQAVAPVPPNLFDRRESAAMKGRQHDGGSRSWGAVTGITLHQTACRLGEKPERWDTIGAHVGVTKVGRVIWMHDFNRVIWHGNGWNAHCVGIEMDGLYAGIEGEIRTVWDDPSTKIREQPDLVTTALVEATKDTVRWICAVVAQHGGKVKYLVAHRQSSNSRRNDPGSALWRRVALELHKELGLTDGGPGCTVGKGLPIPEAWDPTRRGVKY